VGAWVASLPAGASAMSAGAGPREVLLLGESLEARRLLRAMSPGVFQLGSGISQVAVSPDGCTLAVALGKGEVVQRRLRDGRELSRVSLSDGVAKAVGFGPDGALVVAAMGAPAALIRPDGTQVVQGKGDVLRRLGALSDGRLWGLSYGHTVFTWDGRTGAQESRLDGAVFFVGSSSQDGSSAVLADETGGIWRLSGDSWQRVRQDPDIVAVDVGPGGSPLIWAQRRAVCVDGRCTAVEGDVVDIALSHGRIAVATLTGDVWLLDGATGRTLALLRGHTGRVSSVEFGPNGDWLVSGSWDGSVRRWALHDLETPAQDLVRDAEAQWGMTLQEALRSR